MTSNLLSDTRQILFQFMLPKPQNSPTSFLERGRHASVSLNVPVELVFPERSVALGPDAVHRATVPKTSIHEDRDARYREDNIRPPRQRTLNPIP